MSRQRPGGRRGGEGTRAAERTAEQPGGPPPGPPGDPVAAARAVALRQLAGAPRSRAQLEAAMARRDVPADAAAAVLDRFTEVGLVDDDAYAAMLVRSRQATRGLARRGIAHELRAKGVGDDVAARALAEIDPADEEASARDLVARRLPATARLAPEVRLRRLVGMLARKGHPPGVALRVVREALAAEGADVLAEDADAPDEGVL